MFHLVEDFRYICYKAETILFDAATKEILSIVSGKTNLSEKFSVVQRLTA